MNTNRQITLDHGAPRRFGKTISVSMFAAAMLYSTPNLELSIYSTCKRISQKLLRNVYKFLELIYDELGVTKMKEIRLNFEEIELQGCEGRTDVRRVNSYPSKVKQEFIESREGQLVSFQGKANFNHNKTCLGSDSSQCSWDRVLTLQRSASLCAR